MYSVTELARMYNTTRATIYSKLQDESILQYVAETKNGKRLQKEGLNQFQLLMAESKKSIERCTTNTQLYTNYTNEYIDNLKARIAELENDKKMLYGQVEQQNKQIEQQNEIMKSQLLLLNPPKAELNKNWWQFWKKF